MADITTAPSYQDAQTAKTDYENELASSGPKSHRTQKKLFEYQRLLSKSRFEAKNGLSQKLPDSLHHGI